MSEQPKETYWGKVTSDVTVWCGECGHWQEEEATKQIAVARFKEDGWRQHKRLGWLCPECARARFDELPL